MQLRILTIFDCLYCHVRGIEFEAGFVSTAHTVEDIEKTIDVHFKVFEDI